MRSRALLVALSVISCGAAVGAALGYERSSAPGATKRHPRDKAAPRVRVHAHARAPAYELAAAFELGEAKPAQGAVVTRRRPSGTEHGPAALRCRPVGPFRFYIMEEALLDCPYTSGEDLNRRLGRFGGGQYMGEVFFYHQLKNHSLRTYNASEASIVVVPAFLSLLARGQCLGDEHLVTSRLARLLLESPRYQRHQGRDFILVGTDFKAERLMMRYPELRNATRNFIYASRISGKALGWIHDQGRCVIPAPYVSTHDMAKCTGDQLQGLACSPAPPEASFEEFMAKRDINLFFMGQADSREAYKSRRLIVTHASQVKPGPHFLVGVNVRNDEANPCIGPPGNWSGCYLRKHDGAAYIKMLKRSRVSIFARGDDASSSRFYDALSTGTHQIILSDHFYDHAFPFRCALPLDEMALVMSEPSFHGAGNPKGMLEGALEQLYGGGAGLLRRVWEAQMRARPDLLWHLPGSRVAVNLLEEAVRRCTGPARSGYLDQR